MRTRVLQEKNYAERMQNGVEPYLAAHAEEFYWERESGHPIHVLRYRAFRPRGVVVISHGFTENAEKYKEIVELLRKKIKDVSITTDVIVGFPGETSEEFNETYEFLKEIALTKVHIFKFSPRAGTKAEKMTNQIDGKVKDERSKLLQELNEKNENNFGESYVGRTFPVLIEQKISHEENLYSGYTPNYLNIMVKYNGDKDIIGGIVNVKIQSFKGESGLGIITA